jgi:signal transduction histidine kinase/ligand-binding sensor domain-containing protein/DNA-binding response OmpR family regulator
MTVRFSHPGNSLRLLSLKGRLYLPSVIFILALLSSCKKHEDQSIEDNPISEDVVSPSQVTVLAELPDSLQPKTTFIEGAAAPTTIPIPEKHRVYKISNKSGEQIVHIHPEKKIKTYYSPILQNYTAEQGLAVDVTSNLYADRKGNLWFGTPIGGVSKYDGNSFTTYTTSNGLFNNTVEDIIEDKAGNMWFATDHGISKFDGTTFSTIGNFVNVLVLFEDMEGNIWIGTSDRGLYRFNGDSLRQFSSSDGFLATGAKVLKQDQQGTIWIGTWSGLYQFKEEKITRLTDSLEINSLCISKDGIVWVGSPQGILTYDGENLMPFLPIEDLIPCLYIDRKDNIWFASKKDGIFYFNSQSPSHLHSFNGFPYGEIRDIVEDKSGNIWFCTAANGVVKYSGPAFQKITEGSIRSIMEDHDHNIWFVGYEGHLSRFDGEYVNQFGPDLGYWSISEDQSGNLWIGTEVNGLIKYDRRSFTFYNKKNGLPGPFITSIIPGKKGNLWISTLNGVSKFDGKSFTNYLERQGLAGEKAWCILQDQTGALYIGTNEGLSHLDSTLSVITNYSISAKPEGNDIRSIIKDKHGNLWMAIYGGGLCRYDGNSFYTFTTEQGLPDNVVTQVAFTKEGNVIAGTNNGIAILTGFISGWSEKTIDTSIDSTDKSFSVQNNLKNHELKRYSPVFEIYNSQTGYPIMDVNRGQYAIYVDQKGIIWSACGSEKSGLMRFDYSSLNRNNDSPLVNITGIKVNNELVCWNDLLDKLQTNRSSPSKNKTTVPAFVNEEVSTFGKTLPDSVRASMRKKYKAIRFDAVTKFYPVPTNLILPNNHNKITIEFAAIEPGKPSLVQYQYKLEGYDHNWSMPANITSATYGNIDEGKYQFYLKARSPSGIWSEPITYSFTVLPPWYRTWWAFILYAFFLGASVYLTFQIFKRRLILQQQLKSEQDEAIRLKELDTFKSRLFTNLTHEFRTPLTVILGMAKQLAAGSWQLVVGSTEKKRVTHGLELIENNGKNLLQLINQLLDLSKLENKSFKLQQIQSDIIPYLRYLTESFLSLADDLDLSLHFISEKESLVMDFDAEQVKQIMTNLISNALKFTPAGGEVLVNASISAGRLQILVKDTGIGIAENDLPHILDRFYQVDSSSTRVAQGTGIGLAHTQELLKVMDGSIIVESELGKGTTVIIRLPIMHSEVMIGMNEITFSKPYVALERPAKEQITDDQPASQQSLTDIALPQLLVIEDNRDVVEYLRSCLETSFQVMVAYNGQEGVEKALELIPDFIISDVMMPLMDGFQVCDQLKNDEHTSHIPIILLTAKADVASRLTGLRRGADAYMAKPFSPEELDLQISALLENRQRMSNYFSRALRSDSKLVTNGHPIPEAIQIEDAFIKKIKAIIELHYRDEQFALPQLCDEIGMSRSQLFRKMKAIADVSPSDLIRTYRLQKAKTLLEQGNTTVAEVTYKVGFKDPSYFAKMFQEEFGMQPSSI